MLQAALVEIHRFNFSAAHTKLSEGPVEALERQLAVEVSLVDDFFRGTGSISHRHGAILQLHLFHPTWGRCGDCFGAKFLTSSERKLRRLSPPSNSSQDDLLIQYHTTSTPRVRSKWIWHGGLLMARRKAMMWL